MSRPTAERSPKSPTLSFPLHIQIKLFHNEHPYLADRLHPGIPECVTQVGEKGQANPTKGCRLSNWYNHKISMN